MPTQEQIRKDFGLEPELDGALFVSPEDAIMSDQLRGQSHYIRRAFQQLRLDGVLCIDGVPTIYLKKYDRPATRLEINELHSKLWNQGTGTLLVILDPTHFFIFSSMVLPSYEGAKIESHPALVEILANVTNTLKNCQFVTRVASGQYYRTHSSKFNQSNSVDKHLLENLGTIGALLSHDQSPDERKRVHAFLGRIIFTCYLIDRKIIKLQNFSFFKKKNISKLLDLFTFYSITDARELLYKLFRKLRDDFNGSMFDTDFDEEQAAISEKDIELLKRFLSGNELKTGQQALGFWAYDFSVIPVETISAIYEKFLEEEDSSEKEEQGAFYTSKNLAEMVVNEATSDYASLEGLRFLDPACGSGIFLVILFNRVAEDLLRRQPRLHQKTRFRRLHDVLIHQICGIDVNKTACRITCFSLYIAFLDQFDPPTLIDLQKKSGKVLPKLLAYKSDRYQNTSTPAIYEGNFFDASIPIHDTFDIIVGNPPWIGRNQKINRDVQQWIHDSTKNPFLKDITKSKLDIKAVFLHQNQIAQAFMWKTQCHVKDEGNICLLLPAQVLLNQTDAFQHAWFANTKVSKVFNLSDFRLFLFQDAKRPALIIQFGANESDQKTEMVEYIVPKVRHIDPRSGLIQVFPEDRKWIQVDDILQASNPKNESTKSDLKSGVFILWKSYLWGSPRDLSFINYLRQLDCLGDVASNGKVKKRWIKGKGFQPWYKASYDLDPKYGEPDEIPGKLSDPFIETVSDNLQMFVLKSDTISLQKRLESLKCTRRREETSEDDLKASLTGFHRARDKRLYDPPFIVINKGYSKFAFVDFKAFYQDSITGISGRPSDADLLRFLVIYLKSRLANYFLFHTAGSWGTERTEVRVHELMRLPFPLPESPDSDNDAKEIIKEAAIKMKKLQSKIKKDYEKATKSKNFSLNSKSLTESRREQILEFQADGEKYVNAYFKLTQEEITLVNDTCDIIIPSATPNASDAKIETTKQTTSQCRQLYAKTLCYYLNKWSEIDQSHRTNQSFYFRATTTPLTTVDMVLLTLTQASTPDCPVEENTTRDIENVLSKLQNLSTYNHGSFQYLRGVIYGDGKAIHILKPDMHVQWSKTSALNDADQIFQLIVHTKRQ